MARKLPPINSGSMADISFLLLTFFLLTSSINTDLGIIRRLPPPLDPEVKPPEIKQRNIFTVLVNQNNQLLVEGKPSDISLLRVQAKNFMSNPNLKDPTSPDDMPEKKMEDIPLLGGQVYVSKGVISLKNDRGTSYETYIQVQNELAAAIGEVRDELARNYFGMKFDQLTDKDQIKAIQDAVPVAISEAEPENVGGK